jgi:hypothetical protein
MMTVQIYILFSFSRIYARGFCEKRPTAKETAKAPAWAPEVVTVILINGFKVTESGENQDFMILKLFVRPQLRGKYVKLVRSEKQLAVATCRDD